MLGAIAASGGYTEGLLSFGITDVHCNGTEENITLCSQNEVQLHNCQTHDDAGVVCQGRHNSTLLLIVIYFLTIQISQHVKHYAMMVI